VSLTPQAPSHANVIILCLGQIQSLPRRQQLAKILATLCRFFVRTHLGAPTDCIRVEKARVMPIKSHLEVVDPVMDPYAGTAYFSQYRKG
jgi:hypothetical protein